MDFVGFSPDLHRENMEMTLFSRLSSWNCLKNEDNWENLQKILGLRRNMSENIDKWETNSEYRQKHQKKCEKKLHAPKVMAGIWKNRKMHVKCQKNRFTAENHTEIDQMSVNKGNNGKIYVSIGPKPHKICQLLALAFQFPEYKSFSLSSSCMQQQRKKILSNYLDLSIGCKWIIYCSISHTNNKYTLPLLAMTCETN